MMFTNFLRILSFHKPQHPEKYIILFLNFLMVDILMIIFGILLPVTFQTKSQNNFFSIAWTEEISYFKYFGKPDFCKRDINFQ